VRKVFAAHRLPLPRTSRQHGVLVLMPALLSGAPGELECRLPVGSASVARAPRLYAKDDVLRIRNVLVGFHGLDEFKARGRAAVAHFDERSLGRAEVLATPRTAFCDRLHARGEVGGLGKGAAVSWAISKLFSAQGDGRSGAAGGTQMEFGILGPLEVRDGGDLVR